MKRVLWGLLVFGLFSMVMGCGSKSTGTTTSAESFGHLEMVVDPNGPVYDVTYIYVKVVGSKDCAASEIAQLTVPLATNPLSGSVLPTGAGPDHPFADSLFVLPSGNYYVCVIPVINNTGDPTDKANQSQYCLEAGPQEVTVSTGSTYETVITVQCSQNQGGLDVVTMLNDSPIIQVPVIVPGKFITACETATITVTASDSNGDPLTFAFTYQLTSTLPAPGTPLNSTSTLTSKSGVVPSVYTATTTFPISTVGDYTVIVTVTDGQGGSTSLSFPIHVTDCCSPPCGTGQSCCSGICTNLQTDPSNCGSCSNACNSGVSCVDGSCSCPEDNPNVCPTDSTTICTNLQTDPSNCGICGTKCGSDQTCAGGNCVCTDTNLTLCSGVCVDITSNHDNCGGCGSSHACASDQTCVGGKCSCNTGLTLCSSQCVNLLTDTNNCGDCGIICSIGCSGGSCEKVTLGFPVKFSGQSTTWSTTAINPNEITGFSITPSQQITIHTFGIISFSSGPTEQVVAGIYTDDGAVSNSSPSSLLAQTAEMALNGNLNGVALEVPFPATVLSAATKYWIMVLYKDFSVVGMNPTADVGKQASYAYSTTLPSPLTGLDLIDEELNYYIIGW